MDAAANGGASRRSLVDWLIAWYGLFQAGHVILNGRYLISRGDPPFPGPDSGWSPDAVAFLDAFATFDLINAFAAVVFATAWMRGRRWHQLGTITLTISMYAAVAFSYGAIDSGAWRAETTSTYLATWIPFVPVVALGLLWTTRRRLA